MICDRLTNIARPYALPSGVGREGVIDDGVEAHNGTIGHARHEGNVAVQLSIAELRLASV